MMNWFFDVERKLRGWPEEALTITLLLAALVICLIALSPRSPATLKAFAVAYVLLP